MVLTQRELNKYIKERQLKNLELGRDVFEGIDYDFIELQGIDHPDIKMIYYQVAKEFDLPNPEWVKEIIMSIFFGVFEKMKEFNPKDDKTFSHIKIPYFGAFSISWIRQRKKLKQILDEENNNLGREDNQDTGKCGQINE